MFDVGATELLVVAVLAVMLYGGDLPDVARKAGSTVKRLRGVADDLKRQVTLPPEMQSEARGLRAELRKLPQELDLRHEIKGGPAPAKPSAAKPGSAPDEASAEPPVDPDDEDDVPPSVSPPSAPAAPK